MSKTQWWEMAYAGRENIHVEYEMQHSKETIKPGTKIKIKNLRETFVFRCLAYNTKTENTWIDCLDPNGQWRSFRVDQLKGPIKAKKSRKRK